AVLAGRREAVQVRPPEVAEVVDVEARAVALVGEVEEPVAALLGGVEEHAGREVAGADGGAVELEEGRAAREERPGDHPGEEKVAEGRTPAPVERRDVRVVKAARSPDHQRVVGAAARTAVERIGAGVLEARGCGGEEPEVRVVAEVALEPERGERG